MASSGSIESPRAPPLSRRVGHGLGDQQRHQNGRHTGTVGSQSRFDGAGGSSAKAIVSMDLVLLSKLTFSSIHILIDCSLVVTITVVQGNSDGGDEDDRECVCRVAWPSGYYAFKSPHPIVLMTWGVPKHPMRPEATKRRKRIDHCAPFMRQKPRLWLVDARLLQDCYNRK